MHNSPIFLIGYMACGKTTLGRALQGAMPGDVEYVDLDEAIEARAGRSIPEIFAADGEAAFRRMESEMLGEMLTRNGGDKRLVVGCGGGTPCHGDNLDRMLRGGTVVWLRASRERTIARLLDAQDRRPLVAGKSPAELEAFVDANLAARLPHYSRAHLTFDSSRLDSASEIAETMVAFISQPLLNFKP